MPAAAPPSPRKPPGDKTRPRTAVELASGVGGEARADDVDPSKECVRSLYLRDLTRRLEVKR